MTATPDRDVAREPAGQAPAPGSGPAGPGDRRRRLVTALVVGTAAVLVGGGAALTLSGGSDDQATHAGAGPHPAGHGGSPLVLRPVGAPQERTTRDGATRVRLAVGAEVEPAAAGKLPSIPVGAPVRLSFRIAGAGSASMPKLAARRIDPSGAERVALDGGESFFFNRATGEVVVPAAATSASHDHAAGRGLANAVIPGGGYSFSTTLSPGAGDTELDPSRRWLAAAYPGAGRVEVLDLLRRQATPSLDVDGRPGTLAWAPGGATLWVADERASRVSVFDVTAGRLAGTIATEGRVTGIAFAGDGRTALLTGPETRTAVLVDTRRRVAADTVELPQPPTGVAYAPALRAYVTAHEDGSLAVVPLLADGDRVGAIRRIGVGSPAETVGVAPDGRTAVALSAADARMTLVDLRRGRVIRAVEAGGQPRDLAFLGHFALARSASTPELTWVDLDEPSRSNTFAIGSKPGRGLALSGDGRTVLAPSAADRSAFGIDVMMGRPMVMAQIPNRVRADVIAPSGTGLQRTAPGVLEERTVFERAGRHTLQLTLGSGERVRFDLMVSEPEPSTVVVRPQRRRMTARAGERVVVRFAMAGPARDDAEVLAYAAAAGDIRQVRVPAEPVGDGVYEARLRPPAPGTYRVFLTSERAGIDAASSRGAMRLDVKG